MKKEDIISSLDSPNRLESLYRSNPDDFKKVFRELEVETGEPVVLKFWRERLFYETPDEQEEQGEKKGFHYKTVLLVVLLSLISGTLVKLPDILGSIVGSWYEQNFLAFIVISSLAAYYLMKPGLERKKKCALIVLGFFGVLVLSSLPHFVYRLNDSQTSTLSSIYMPLFYCSLFGIIFCGDGWRKNSTRIEFLRYIGELIIFTTIILLGGIVLTAVTLFLFDTLGLRIEDWYISYVVAYGSVASPIVATFLIDKVLSQKTKIAPILAKIFTPLFLITVACLLIGMIFSTKNLFADREYLIGFNLLLVLVLLLSIFSIIERGEQKEILLSDYLSNGLVYVTLLVNIVALSAVIYRLVTFGVSPNKIAVLGSNLVIFIHLVGLAYYYTKSIREKHLLDSLQNMIGGYLPVYALWSVIVAFLFPIIFWFE